MGFIKLLIIIYLTVGTFLSYQLFTARRIKLIQVPFNILISPIYFVLVIIEVRRKGLKTFFEE